MPEILAREAEAKLNEYVTAGNRSKRRPLTPWEAKQIEEGKNNPIFIYNVSPIHAWLRQQGQLGSISIAKRDWKQSISEPAVIPGVVVRWYRRGIVGGEEPFIESGMEIAEDVCGTSPTYDAAENKNLSRFGVFISMRPFDLGDTVMSRLPRARVAELRSDAKHAAKYVLPEPEQKELIQQANEKLLKDLEFRILEADNYYDSGPTARKFIYPIHREALKAHNQITNQKMTKPWSTLSMGEALESCLYCGNQNKPGLAVCAGCKNVLNKELFEKLKKQIGA